MPWKTASAMNTFHTHLELVRVPCDEYVCAHLPLQNG
jgi:hypothetical protein